MTAPYVPLVAGQVWQAPNALQRGLCDLTSDLVQYREIIQMPDGRWETSAMHTTTWTEWREWVERTGATCRTEAET